MKNEDRNSSSDSPWIMFTQISHWDASILINIPPNNPPRRAAIGVARLNLTEYSFLELVSVQIMKIANFRHRSWQIETLGIFFRFYQQNSISGQYSYSWIWGDEEVCRRQRHSSKAGANSFFQISSKQHFRRPKFPFLQSVYHTSAICQHLDWIPQQHLRRSC